MSSIETRVCKNCGEQPIVNFYCYKNKAGRLRYHCKTCTLKKVRKYETGTQKETRIEYHRKRRADHRWQVLCHYSQSETPFCECCKETHREFLCLDHKDGGGTQHRKLVGKNMYHWVVKNKFPPMFRVLCYNCNASYGAYGFCPHHNFNPPDAYPVPVELEVVA